MTKTVFDLNSNSYASKEDLVEAAKSWGKEHGYFLSIKHSERDRVVLICSKGGCHRQRYKKKLKQQKQTALLS
jgi:hypothetical protein